jgi:hypothetical protein
VHQSHIGAQEPHILGLSHEPRSLEPLVEQALVKGTDLPASLEVMAVEPDEIAVLREQVGKGGAIVLVPGVHQPPMQVGDGSLVCRVRGGVVRA